jgi:DNA mismatch repair protein MutS2
MGRERAHTATPLIDVAAVESAIALTTEARLALGAERPPPLDGIADIRPVLERCAAEGSLLEGPELVLLIPVLEAGPRLKAWGQAIQSVGPDLARLTDHLPRLTDLRDTLRHALEDDGTLTDRASPRCARSGSRCVTGGGGSSPTSSACSRPRATGCSPTGS